VYRKTLGLAFYISTAIKKKEGKWRRLFNKRVSKKKERKKQQKGPCLSFFDFNEGVGNQFFSGRSFGPPARSSSLCPNEANK
jgi:hypothetical protein